MELRFIVNKIVIKEQLLQNSVRIRKEGKTVGSGFLYVLPEEQRSEYAYILTAAHIFERYGYELTMQVFSNTRNRTGYDFETEEDQVKTHENYSFGKGMAVFQEYDAAIVKIPYRNWMNQCKKVVFGTPYEDEPVGGIAYSSATTDEDIRYDYQIIKDTALTDIYSDSMRMRIQVKGDFYLDHSCRAAEISGMSGAVIASDDENTFLLGLFVSIADYNGAFGKANLIKMDGHIQLLEKEGVKPEVLDMQNVRHEIKDTEYLVISEKEVVSDWHFVHREEEMSNVQKFLEQDGIVVLTGIGGIGKTSLARQYAAKNRHKYKAIHQISCRDSVFRGLSEAISISILPRERHGEVLETDEAYGKRILQWLKQHEESDVLYIFDDISPEDQAYSQVKALRAEKILTSRWSKDRWICPVVEVSELKSIEEQKALFSQYYERELYENEQDNFAAISSMVEGHSLTLALIATYCREAAVGLERIRDLLEREGICNEESTPFMFAETKEASTAYGHIKAILDFSSLNEEEKRLMAFLSLLPSEGIIKEELKLFLGENIFEVLNPLRQRGWIQEGFVGADRWVFLHNIISEVVYREIYLKENYTYDKYAEYVMVDVDHIRDISFDQQRRVLLCGEILSYRLKDGIDKVNLLLLLVNQYEYTRQTKEAFATLARLKMLLDKLGLNNSLYRGHYHNQMAMIFQREENMTKALVNIRRARKIYKQCGKEAIGNYALALHNEAKMLCWLGKDAEAIELEDEAEPLLKKYNPSYVGYVYDLRAHTYSQLVEKMVQNAHKTRGTMAEFYMSRARELLLKEFACLDHAVEYKAEYQAPIHEVASSLARRAVVSSFLGNVKKAIADIHKALEFYEKTSERDSEDIAHIYEQMCIIYEKAGDLKKACHYGELAVQIFERRLGANASATKMARYNLEFARNSR